MRGGGGGVGEEGGFKLAGFNQATALVSPLRHQICLNPVWLGVLRSSTSLRSRSDRSASLREPSEPNRQTGFRQMDSEWTLKTGFRQTGFRLQVKNCLELPLIHSLFTQSKILGEKFTRPSLCRKFCDKYSLIILSIGNFRKKFSHHSRGRTIPSFVHRHLRYSRISTDTYIILAGALSRWASCLFLLLGRAESFV